MSEGLCGTENIPTFVALPVDTLQDTSTFDKPEQFRIIKNAIIKTLSDGSLCIIDATDLNENVQQQQQQQIEITYVPPADTTPQPISKPPSPIYKCPKCKETFDKIASYRKHMMWHRNIKKYKCEKCSAGYNVEINLKIHMAMHTDGKPTCPACHISFQRLASLKSHLMLHQVEEFFTCEECGAEFEKDEELGKHLQNHMNNTVQESNSLVCSYCNVQFEDQKSYKEHISHHVKIKKMVLSGKKSRKTNGNKNYPHVCSVCLKSFSKLSLLERHLRVHSGERPFICQHCNKGFNQKGTLQIHLSKHTGVKPFQCTLCSAKFNQKGNLRVHVEKTHTAPMPGVKVYKCPHCTCIFKKIASLNVHITKCHANNEEVSDIMKVMNQLKSLEEQTNVAPSHVERSDGVTSYVRLAESFLDGTVRRYLVMQKKVNDVKSYICSYCSKEFKKPSDLIRHTRVHTREKPFSCKQCGASFALKSTLFYHVKTHLGSNNYCCVICTKKFSSARSVAMHLRKHTQKPEYKCLSCNKWFPTIQKAKLHNREHHSDPNAKAANIEMKQPLVHTSTGLLPLPPPKSPAAATAASKQFPCPICNTKFSKMPNLKRHMLLHNGDRKFKCEQCMKSYCTAHALREHMLHHSGIKNFACKVCAKQFMTSSLLKRHMISHSTSRPYVCPYCSKNFKSVALCRKHMNVHRKEINLQMPKEPDKPKIGLTDPLPTNTAPIENAQNVIQLANNIQDTNQINQQQLYEITPNAVQVITDANNQEPNPIQTILINCDDLQLYENLYTQNSDNVLFNTLNELQNSTFSIDPLTGDLTSQSNEYASEQANVQIVKVSANKKTDENNILASSNVPYYQNELNLLFNLDTEFEANNCDLPNENLNLPDINLNEVPVLNVETPIESGVQEVEKKPFSCSKCSKVFNNKKAYTKHTNSHEESKVGMNSHECSFCGKGFKKHSDLVRHIRTHTGEKPFACDKCEKRFSLKSTLLSHERTHNPSTHKQFSCVVCNSFFTSKSSLKVHMTVHTGDKTHKCNFCPMKFRTAAHRKSHENSYHTNPSKKRTKNKVTNLLASVAMDVLDQQQEQNVTSDLENVLVVQEPILNLLNQEPNQLEPLILQQLQSNFLLQDNLIPSSLIQLDDGTLLNIKTVSQDEEQQSEKPRNFECDICHKKYASKDVLRKHKKIHGVDKKFRCVKCEKGFDLEEDLQLHEKTHEGFRPFNCLYCANSFSKEHSLITHMKRIHNISLKDNTLLDM